MRVREFVSNVTIDDNVEITFNFFIVTNNCTFLDITKKSYSNICIEVTPELLKCGWNPFTLLSKSVLNSEILKFRIMQDEIRIYIKPVNKKILE